MRIKNIFIFLVFAITVSTSSFSQVVAEIDSTTVKKDTLNLRYNFTSDQTGGLFLDYLAKKEIIFDATLNKYVILYISNI